MAKTITLMFLKNIGLIEKVTSDRNDSGFHKPI